MIKNVASTRYSADIDSIYRLLFDLHGIIHLCDTSRLFALHDMIHCVNVTLTYCYVNWYINAE